MARTIVLSRRARGTTRGRQGGVTLIEMLAVLAIGALMIAGLSQMVNRSLNDTRDQQVAQYQSQLAAALSQSINVNYSTLVSSIPVGTTSTAMSVANMVANNYIPQSYANAQNAFGQSYCLLLQQPVSGQIDALLVSTGGTTIPDVDLAYIAANAGIGGGSVSSTQPANAVGAYGGWTAPLANWNAAGCKAAPGHLANQIFMTGPGSQPTDFLYRSAVPGRPDLNAMNVAIGLPVVTAGAGCTNPTATSVAAATDASSHLMTCIGGTWTPTTWREPVPNVAALKLPGGLQGAVAGETRVTSDTHLPYVWDGSKWVPTAVDDNGALNFPTAIAANSACGLDVNGNQQANAAQIGVDSNGVVYTCQNGTWTSTVIMLPGTIDTHCQWIMWPSSAPPYDYANCLPPNGDFEWDATSQTMNNNVWRQVTLKNAGLITVTAFGHMNYAQCGQTGWLGQLTQYLDIEDASKNSVAHTEAQTPNIQDASAGVNESLSLALPQGTYYVQIRTNWGAFTGPGAGGHTWTSSYCPASGNTVINTPLAMGWDVSTSY